MNIKVENSGSLLKKSVKKQIEKDRKMFPSGLTKNVEPSKPIRLKTEPIQTTQLSEIYKKLGNISVVKEKP